MRLAAVHAKMTEAPKRSRRACSDPVGNGVGMGETKDGNGCTVCNNDGEYGFGKSACGRCGRCHGCGSSNTGIGPVQAVYFGGKKIVQKLFPGKKEDATAESK
jgi:hypothetical protein